MDEQGEHIDGVTDDNREERVNSVVETCANEIGGMLDGDGHRDLRAINLVMLRLRNEFGG